MELTIASLHAAFSRKEYRSVIESAFMLCEKQPSNGAAWHLKGAAHLALEEGEEARLSLEKASSILSGSADVWDHLGAAMRLCREHTRAEECFRKSLRIQPRRVHAMMNGAANAADSGDYPLMLSYAESMINVEGGVIHGLKVKIDALRKMDKKSEALKACRELLQLEPKEVATLKAAAKLAADLDQHNFVIETCDKALSLDSDDMELYSFKSRALQATGRLSDAVSLLESLVPMAEERMLPGLLSTLAFNYQYLGSRTPLDNLTHAKRFGELAATLAVPYNDWLCDFDPERALKVGLVTGDLRRHPIGHFMVEVIKALYGSSITLTVFDSIDKHDDMTARIKPWISAWHNISGMEDRESAEFIHGENQDILIDLAGHSASNRLVMMASRPAPLQVTWAGYLATTGNPSIDFVICDPISVPPGGEAEFSEEVLRLPESTYCFSAPQEDAPIVEPPVIKNGYITFGSCNNPDKFTDEVFNLWGRVLEAVPGSRLLLKGRQWAQSDYLANSRRRMALAGLDLERVDIEGPSRERPFASYNRMDITLDPFPYSGGTSTVEALWTGVPVLVMKGDRMVWRMGESFLNAVGLMDWLADDHDSYVALAAKKAADINGLVALRRVQRKLVESSILFDSRRFANHLEDALRSIWRKKCGSVCSLGNNLMGQ